VRRREEARERRVLCLREDAAVEEERLGVLERPERAVPREAALLCPARPELRERQRRQTAPPLPRESVRPRPGHDGQGSVVRIPALGPTRSAGPQPALEQQDQAEEGEDEQELARAATLERGPDDEQDGREGENGAGGEDERAPRAQADGGSGAFEWGSGGAGEAGPARPKTLRFAHASGS
jgi:hypothetical protein